MRITVHCREATINLYIYIYILIECAKRESAIQEMEEINQLIDINV